MSSARWCATCHAWGDHHTDRHAEHRAILTNADLDRMLAHAESPGLRDALLDIRNGCLRPAGTCGTCHHTAALHRKSSCAECRCSRDPFCSDCGLRAGAHA